MLRSKIVFAMLLAGLLGSARAQSLPQPREFYFDEDRWARPIVVAQGEGEALAQALVHERERGRRAVEATAQLAHVAYQQGRAELGKGLYAQAQAATQPDRGIGRSITWNYGWDLYRNGEPEAALAQWRTLVGSSLGGPEWIPPTLALALWTLGRKDEAVRWYAAAVRTDPLRWGNPAQLPGLLPSWQDAERATLADVQAAWAANPPRWP